MWMRGRAWPGNVRAPPGRWRGMKVFSSRSRQGSPLACPERGEQLPIGTSGREGGAGMTAGQADNRRSAQSWETPFPATTPVLFSRGIGGDPLTSAGKAGATRSKANQMCLKSLNAFAIKRKCGTVFAFLQKKQALMACFCWRLQSHPGVPAESCCLKRDWPV